MPDEAVTDLTEENLRTHEMRESVRSAQEEFGEDIHPLDLFANLAVPVSPGTNEVDYIRADANIRNVLRTHRVLLQEGEPGVTFWPPQQLEFIPRPCWIGI